MKVLLFTNLSDRKEERHFVVGDKRRSLLRHVFIVGDAIVDYINGLSHDESVLIQVVEHKVGNGCQMVRSAHAPF